MGAGYLVDSNAIIDLGLGRLPTTSARWLEQRINKRGVSLSVITRIELLTKTQPVVAFMFMQALVNSVLVLPLDEPVIQQTIALRQQPRIKLPDAIIAATALAHGLLLVARNTSDFQRIPGLMIINPHAPAQLPAT
ncbi:MAG: type II toxin-antitoxin system VapC family toxin [Hymenobacter sp.]|nr:MAG: type II toxin-antitoxin system VapC family toxin [Hymenobacter sp.]